MKVFFTLLVYVGTTSAFQILANILEVAKESPSGVDTFINFPPLSSSSGAFGHGAYIGLQEFSPHQHENNVMIMERGRRRQLVMRKLLEHAKTTQGPLVDSLKGMGYQVEQYWINNSVLVKDAPLHLLSLLIQLASKGDPIAADIVSISPNRVIARIPSQPLHSEDVSHSHLLANLRINSLGELKGLLPSLQMIKADKAWMKTRGEGVVVANIDTGVDFLHPQIKNKYRGFDATLKTTSHEYNWYEPDAVVPFPHDVHGHGTHTLGTIVGENIGVAPGAKWIAARGCGVEQCKERELLAAAQWVMCPTDSKGENPRCDLGADVINNSWGGGVTDEASLTWFSAASQAWTEAGMIPIFAMGNSGPGCGTAGTPGDLTNVIGVGAIDEKGSLTFFSSRGPGSDHNGHAVMKPDLVAPGQAIISCKRGATGELIAMSGTSMASPHVAGAAALFLSIRPDLTFTEFRDFLLQSANQDDLIHPAMGEISCGGILWNKFPNYHYGHGLLDLERSIQSLDKGDEKASGSILAKGENPIKIRKGITFE